MKAIVPNEEFIQKNYNKTIDLLDKFELDNVKRLVTDFANEYALAPASTDVKYHCAFPGGLCYHNLHVLQWLGRITSALSVDPKNSDFDKKSLLKIAVLHDFGKVGTEKAAYYLPTSESWKMNRGIYFEINPELNYMKIPQRSLHLAYQAGVDLSEEEYLAILLADGHLDETNSHYRYKEPKLAVALHYAVYWARLVSKEFKVRYP